MKARPKQPKPGPPPPLRHKWLFRLLALLVLPALAIGLLEAGLRLGGFGHSTGLFEKVQIDGRDFLVNNESFSLRFFPPELSRWPSPLMMEAEKPAGTCRIFIFGESAAQGDPEPSYGAGRYLDVLLRERYPGVNFEVVNVAITAINSHVIVPIARECAQRQGDLWIVYMGNNEMIGPYGAATVFGAKALPWPLVRMSVALQATRTGQLLMDLARKIKGTSSVPGVWGGLQMFLGNQIAPDDSRREVVYKNYRRNLQDILRAGRDSGARIILSTVAVNLKDCPPFASLPSGKLSESDRSKCTALCKEGRESELVGDWKTAVADFDAALALDPRMADAQYGKAEYLLQSGNITEARQHFQSACDSDALPFRADGRINGIIHETANTMSGPGLELCAAAETLPEPGKIPGQETFYEHVHFNFDGNYRLARLWADAAAPLLPEDVKDKAKGEWASQQICEERLGLTDWNRCDVLASVQDRMEKPPLSAQFKNQQRLAALDAQLNHWSRQRTEAAAPAARALYLDAINRAPRDYMLHENYAEFLELTGDARQAAEEWKAARVLMPRNPLACFNEGRMREKFNDLRAARECFERAIALHPRYAEAWLELGKVDASEKKLEPALQNYRRAAELQPSSSETYLVMGKVLSLLKRTDESVQSFKHALELDGSNWEAHYALGGELGMHGHFDQARGEFEQVVRLQPQYAMGHLNLGVALLKLNDPAGARREFSEALRLDPSNKSARDFLAAVSAGQHN